MYAAALLLSTARLMLDRVFYFAGGCLFLIFVMLATAAPLPPPNDSSPVSADTTKSLRPLMVGLAQDMDRISTGLWYEDYDLIQQGAENIAQHPKIPPEQLSKIKAALGDQFSNFVQYDKGVHRSATKLVSAAEAKDWSAVLKIHNELQQGCVSCHSAYREQLRPVLRP
jgi:hypothetical protein